MNKAEYTSLVNIANYHSHLYYVASTPAISDAEFDAMLVQLQEYEEQHPADILPDSPTQRVGSDLSANGRALVAHRTPMLSQQKAHTIEEVQAWIDRSRSLVEDNPYYPVFDIICTWKYDGISCSLVYIDGNLVSAATRGDGNKGQDLMQHVALMASVPSHIEWKGRLEVRGEIVCPVGKHVALGYNDERTAAAAICNAAYSDAAELLVFYPWEIIRDGKTGIPARWELHKFGFMETIYWQGQQITDEFIKAREAERKHLSFPVDGLVFKVSSSSQFESLGANKHHPHGSIAYKFSANSITTTVTDIEIRVAKSGRRTPVAHITPVSLMGKTITKVNLYSERTMQNLGVTEGCTVTVAMQNDVTPKIISVEGFTPAPVPTAQPVAETATEGLSWLSDDIFDEGCTDEEEYAPETKKTVSAPIVCAVAILALSAVTAMCACGAASVLFIAPLLGGAFKAHIMA